MNKIIMTSRAVLLFLIHPDAVALPITHWPHSENLKQISSATQGTPLQLTLGDAIYLGLRKNPSIRSAYIERTVQKYDLEVAEDIFNPKLRLRGGYRIDSNANGEVHHSDVTPEASLITPYGTRLNLSWMQQYQFKAENGRYRSDGLDFSVIQPLLKGAGKEVNMSSLQQARIAEQINKLLLKNTVSQAISEIATAYRELLLAQENVRINENALVRSRELESINEALISNGQMAANELFQTQTESSRQELSVLTSRHELEQTRQNLLQTIGLDINTQIYATDSLEIKRISMSYDKALKLAQQQQANFLITILNTRQAELGLIMAKDQNRWSLDLTFGTKQIRENTHDTKSTTHWDNSVGVVLEIPLSDRSLKREQLRAQADIKIQNIALEEAHRNLAHQIRSVLNELDTRWKEYEIAAHTVKLAQQTLSAEYEKLKFGRSSNFQIISFENQLREMESTHQSSRIAYQNALTRFELILGMTLESWEITLNDS